MIFQINTTTRLFKALVFTVKEMLISFQRYAFENVVCNTAAILVVAWIKLESECESIS